MTHSSENRIDLRGDGRIILYKRTGSKDPVWQARIRVPNSTGYKIVSAKTEAHTPLIYAASCAKCSDDGHEGIVGVSVVIDANGRVQSCTVTASSGESVLDEAACEAIERYARYEPALNNAGKPTTGRDSLTITYRLN